MRTSESIQRSRPAVRQARSLFPPFTPGPSTPERFPSLDGIRAVAIGIVFVNHATTAGKFSPAVTALLRNPLIGLPGLGVTIFLVVSGFLITSILLREIDRRQTIDFTRFCLRRSLRIFPAYFVFVAVVAVLAWAGWLSVGRRSFVYALTFTMNYAGQDAVWALGHLWSMGSQEQFYVLWPLVLVWLGRRDAARLALATVLIAPVVSVVYATVAPAAFAARTSPFAFDTIAVGCLLAVYRDRLGRLAWFNALVDSRIGALLVYVIAIIGNAIGTRPGLLVHPCVAVAVALVVERCVRRPQSAVGRLLNTPAMIYVGGMTFSLYLWQQLFLRPGANLPWPVAMVAAVSVAFVSYQVVERPTAKLWPRIEGVLGKRRVVQAAPMSSITALSRSRAMRWEGRAAAGGA